MKKLLSTLLLVVAIFAATTAQAQIKFGVKGGLNVTDMSLSADVIDKSNQTGFFIGPTVKFTLPLVGLGIDAAALYDQRDAELNDEKISQKSINIPVNLRYNIGLGSLAGIYVAAGPQFGFNVGDKDFGWGSAEYKNTFQMKKSNFSINLGAGLSLLKHLEIGFTYNIACGNTGEVSVWNVAKGAAELVKGNKTNAWQVSAAYYF
ncbi:MAG: porin family protein [Prevotella sp.]|nr:porin family protein [Prevotella sp.]